MNENTTISKNTNLYVDTAIYCIRTSIRNHRLIKANTPPFVFYFLVLVSSSVSSLLAELRGKLTALDPGNGGSRKGGSTGVPVFLITDMRTAAWKQTLKDAIVAEGFGVRRAALMEKEILKVGDLCPLNH